MLNAAVIQMVSGASVDKNLSRAVSLLETAKSGGANLAVLPENFLVFGQKEKPSISLQKDVLAALGEMVRDLDMWLVAGTLPLHEENIRSAIISKEDGDYEKSSGSREFDSLPYAASVVFNNKGDNVGEYLKIHLFDARIGDGANSYRESDDFSAGHQAKIFPTPWQEMGVAVCYDLRFPEIFTQMNQAGAKFICVPSAFTQATGAAHWEILLRARAIENQCFILAANQGGRHFNGRETFGHSMIISPWGEVLSQLTKGDGVILESLDFNSVDRVREAMPMSEHRRLI